MDQKPRDYEYIKEAKTRRKEAVSVPDERMTIFSGQIQAVSVNQAVVVILPDSCGPQAVGNISPSCIMHWSAHALSLLPPPPPPPPPFLKEAGGNPPV